MAIKLENWKNNIPAIEYTYYENPKKFKVDYGPNRGYHIFDTEAEALAALDEWLDNHMHTLIKRLDALAALKRKTQKRILEVSP
jgi:hypothetical protein